jgi:hypothetical protein
MKITHLTVYSLSGAISHIILKNCFRNIRYIVTGYDKLQKNIDELYMDSKHEQLFVTNLAVTEQQYEQLKGIDKKLIFVDHHFNSEKFKLKEGVQKQTFINMNFSSCWLIYKLFVNKYLKENENKEALEKLAFYGNMYDLWDIDDEKFTIAYALNELFWKMGFDVFVNEFSSGFRVLKNEEKIFVNARVEDKKERISKLKFKELENDEKENIKNSVLFMMNTRDSDLINDIPLVYPKYDIYFIYLNDKQKLTIKHKTQAIMSEILEKLFRNRDDELMFSGDCKFGTLNYYKIDSETFNNDLEMILKRM